MSSPYDDFVARPAADALAPATDLALVRELANTVRRSERYLSNVRAEAAVALSQLRHAEVDAARLQQLLIELARLGLLGGFLRMAQPRNSSELLPWLMERGVGWRTILEHYEWEPRDSLDIFFGVLLGACGSLVEDAVGLGELAADGAKAVAERPELRARIAAAMSPPTAAVLQLAGLKAAFDTLFDKGAAQAPRAYLQVVLGVTLPKISASGALEAIGHQAKAWSDEFDALMMRLEFFKAGIHLGRAVGQILGLIEAGVGMAKVFPKLAQKGAALLAELPGRIRALGRHPSPAAVEALAKELSVTEALAGAEDLAQGARPPFKVSRKDLRDVLEFGGIKETADGNLIMRVPCAG